MTILMTGFPGFLAGAMLPRLLERTDQSVVCVVQAKYAVLAEERLARLAAEQPSRSGQVQLVHGDITRPHLGLEDPVAVTSNTTEIWHLAAAYDLAVSHETGMRINVAGTTNVLDTAETCPRLERLHYFSTCYVSGRYAGPFGEDDFEVGAPFNNSYEETKHLAEAHVRARISMGLPTTIYRPPIVLGDSRTGATSKFDGLYFIIQLLLRQPRVALLPVLGDPSSVRANIVPSDFVVDAALHLADVPQSLGTTYHLADPHPLTVDEWYDALAEATERRLVRIPVPKRLAQAALARTPGATSLLGLPAELLDYFVLPTHYLTDHTRAHLAGTGIECPPFASYAANIVDFVRRHRDVSSRAMI